MNHPEITSVGAGVYHVHLFSLHFALGPDIFETELSFPKYEVHFMTSQ